MCMRCRASADRPRVQVEFRAMVNYHSCVRSSSFHSSGLCIGSKPKGISNYLNLISQTATIQGFLVYDYPFICGDEMP